MIVKMISYGVLGQVVFIYSLYYVHIHKTVFVTVRLPTINL